MSKHITKKTKKIIINISFVVVSILLSILTGFLIKDPIMGSILIFFTIMDAFTSAVGRKSNFIYGIIVYCLWGYVAFNNHYYGTFAINCFLCAPLLLLGEWTWNSKMNKTGVVKKRKFTLRTGIITVLSCILGSLLISGILSLIPNQSMAFMDATSTALNICGILLFVFRYSESWIVWLVNNFVDLSLWIIALLSDGPGAISLLIVCIINTIVNIYSIYVWFSKARVKKTKLDAI